MNVKDIFRADWIGEGVKTKQLVIGMAVGLGVGALIANPGAGLISGIAVASAFRGKRDRAGKAG